MHKIQNGDNITVYYFTEEEIRLVLDGRFSNSDIINGLNKKYVQNFVKKDVKYWEESVVIKAFNLDQDAFAKFKNGDESKKEIVQSNQGNDDPKQEENLNGGFDNLTYHDLINIDDANILAGYISSLQSKYDEIRDEKLFNSLEGAASILSFILDRSISRDDLKAMIIDNRSLLNSLVDFLFRLDESQKNYIRAYGFEGYINHIVDERIDERIAQKQQRKWKFRLFSREN